MYEYDLKRMPTNQDKKRQMRRSHDQRSYQLDEMANTWIYTQELVEVTYLKGHIGQMCFPKVFFFFFCNAICK